MNFTPTINPDNRFIFIDETCKESFYIGSTVTQYFSLPFNWDNFVDKCTVTYKQGLTNILTKDLEKDNQSASSCTAKVTLLPEDTILFQANLLTTCVQARVVNKDGEISYYGPWEIKVLQPISQENAGNDDIF